MNEIELISRLARASDAASVEVGDCAGRVLASLRRERDVASRALPIGAAIGGVLAIAMVFMASEAWSSLSNPLSDLAGSPADVVAQ